jgi:hypothetical protein
MGSVTGRGPGALRMRLKSWQYWSYDWMRSSRFGFRLAKMCRNDFSRYSARKTSSAGACEVLQGTDTGERGRRSGSGLTMVDEGCDDFCVGPLGLCVELVGEPVPTRLVRRLDLCEVGLRGVEERPERDEVALDGFGDGAEGLERGSLCGCCLCDSLLLCDLLCFPRVRARDAGSAWRQRSASASSRRVAPRRRVSPVCGGWIGCAFEERGMPCPSSRRCACGCVEVRLDGRGGGRTVAGVRVERLVLCVDAKVFKVALVDCNLVRLHRPR